MTIETPTPSEMESMIASAKASSNAEMTAAPQMPSEPRQCQHGNWNAADCKDCKIKSLQAEVERLRNCYATEVRTAQAYLRRTEQSERKLAEAEALRKMVKENMDALQPRLKPSDQPWDISDHEAQARWNVWAVVWMQLNAIDAARSTEERHG